MKTSEHNMNHTGEMEQKGNGNGEIKRHLLLVEDDKASLLYYQELVKFMESPGIEICLHVVTSGEEAVAYCSKYPVDIVLLDIRLPGMDGWETAQKIKDLEPQITVIAQTGYSLSGHYQKSLDSGCDHYLAKPVPMDKFIDTISRYL
jgi:CheY-like chemotaxis protein